MGDMPRVCACLLCLAMLAAVDPASEALDQFTAANQARRESARESATSTAERQRLEALIAATEAETARLVRAAAQAETTRDAARTRLATLGTEHDPAVMRAALAEAGAKLAAGLRTVAATQPPGTVVLGHDDFDSAVRALEGAEHAASTVTVEVVTGTREGRSEAVKLLRVAGAAAWWVSLDGLSAGTASMSEGYVVLVAVNERGRIAIQTALAQAEGRAPAAIVVLP